MREDWIEVELGEACEIQTGKHDANHAETNGKYRFYTCAYEYTFCNTNRFKGKSIILPGNGANVGEVFYYDGEFDAYQRTYVINQIKIYPKYLFYHLKCFWKSRNIGKQYGSATNYIRIGNFLDYKLSFPSLPEQRAIVQKTENYFDIIDTGIIDLKIAQKQLTIYRQAVLKKAFEGGFTNNIVKENELPEGWEMKRLGDVAEINPKLPNKEEIDLLLEVQFLPMKLVEEEINKIHLIETKLFHEVQKGSYTPFIENDIVFAKITPCMENGKIAIMKNIKNKIGYGSSEFHVIRCKGEVLNNYVFHFVVQAKFRKEAEMQMTGAVGQRRVPKKFLEDYFIPLPPTLEEQHAIVREIESRLSVCDKVEQSISEALEKAEALRQSILKKAFEGKLLNEEEIAKCKQEADYEPASVLLERIKKEKKHEK